MTDNDATIKNTMDIILFSGDARTLIMQSMDLLGDCDYQKAQDLMKQAHEKLVKAHQLQTDRLRDEADGETLEYSVLFTHAQDTMMTVNTEYNLVKHLISVFEKRDQNCCEKKCR
ncbi:PTS lactose/cellobiose transporter subunit IIA [Companilactobacillus halodurans]|uniref:PTS lactose/cellobiose transporter subunit IIA n=1 Tax=Companilactobacillus halodurans TaxID=2584183 RepID=A0A5P0ZZ29_9LACO|nr:PTS lactose/cellobiose transporter subunit IIA [Companilactobacillus halodurans]MQS76579.1 PTS lactose/cellobiose transporter subunit IIA [Companilactobacillus halodurans]MQS98217.1 PTS lactose/cellobiose transporter subunit IIA [Companilactobacillus halodurans]